MRQTLLIQKQTGQPIFNSVQTVAHILFIPNCSEKDQQEIVIATASNSESDKNNRFWMFIDINEINQKVSLTSPETCDSYHLFFPAVDTKIQSSIHVTFISDAAVVHRHHPAVLENEAHLKLRPASHQSRDSGHDRRDPNGSKE